MAVRIAILAEFGPRRTRPLASACAPPIKDLCKHEKAPGSLPRPRDDLGCSAISVLRADHVPKRGEVVVDAKLHQMHLLADADPLAARDGADLRRNVYLCQAGGQHVLQAEIEIVVLELGRPVAKEGVLDADAGHI